MSDVFISYSRKNSDFVHKLDDALTKVKRDVWVDWADIGRGQDWWHEIQVGVDSADTALIVMTENWLVSEICQRELEYIRQQNKRVFPIIRQRIEGDVAIRVKGTWVDQEWEQRARDNWKYLRSVNWLFFDDDSTFDSMFQDLLTALDTDQVYVKSHTRYLVRALEWQQSQRDPSFLLEGDQLASAQTWLTSSVGKLPEPHPAHHEYVTASHTAEIVRIARDKTREQLIKRSRQASIGLGVLVVVAIIAAVVVGQQFISARAEVTKAGATLQQVNLQVTEAINQQVTAAAKVQAAGYQVATAMIEQGNAVLAQQTSAAREYSASTQVAIAGATLSPVPPTLTAVALAINDAVIQQDIALRIVDASLRVNDKLLSSAFQIADDMVATYPNAALAYLGRGLIWDSSGKTDEAIADYTKALQIDPQYEPAYNNRGLIYYKQGKFDEALADFTKIIEIDPQYTDPYNNRGLVYYRQGKFDEALADFTKTIEIDPNYTFAYENRGLVYADQNKLDEAIAEYTQAIQIDPGYVDAYNDRGRAYYRQGQYDKALADFTKTIEIDPNYTFAYENRGLVYADQNKLNEAIAEYTQAIQIDAGYVDAYNDRGRAYYLQGQYDKALADFTQAVQIDPTFANAYYNRGLVYYQQGQYDEAIADFTQAIQIAPQYVDAYNDRGRAYDAQDKFDKALADINRAIELNPEYALPYSNRGYVYAEQGKLTEALADYWKWIQLNETSSADIEKVAQGQTPFTTSVQMIKGLTYRIPFEAKAGQIVHAQATAAEDAEVDPLLVILDPQGKPILFNDDADANTVNALIADSPLPGDGVYTLIVSYAGAGAKGDINVMLDLKSAAIATPSPTPTPE